MKSRVLFLFFICGFGLSYAALTSAAESVRSSPSVKVVGGFGYRDRSIDELITGDSVAKKFIDDLLMKKFRQQHECVGPNNEKDAPTQKQSDSNFRCTDLFTYESATKKREDLAKMCKRECIDAATKSAAGKSAAALTTCLSGNCEKQCDFKNALRKVELDSFIRGALEQDSDNAASM